MTDWETGDLPVNDTTIHYTRTGGNKPPFVLAHGYTDNGLCWTRVAQALEADFDVIMPDARGHGFSPGPDSAYTSDLHADDLAGLIGALGLGKPLVMGHSMGAVNTAVLAERYPDSVSAIVLVDPPWHLQPGQNTDNWHTWKQNSIANKQTPRAELIESCQQANPHWHPTEHETWADSKRQFDPRAFDLFNIMERDWRQTARAVTCPALLITGDTSLGAMVTPDTAAEAKRIAPNLQVAHIANAGHSIQRDQFETLINTVRTFISQIK